VAVCQGVLLLTWGCDRFRTAGADLYPPLGDPKAIQQIEKKIHMALPKDVALVAESDGGGRDPQYKFYLWVLYSQSGFSLTPTGVSSVRRPSHKADEALVADLIRPYLPRGRLPQATGAIGADWETSGLEFRANVLKSRNGEFLYVEQIRS